jgi:hypothetical protein
MKAFFSTPQSEAREKVVEAIRELLIQHFPVSQEISTKEEKESFFFKSGSQIIWGRIFFLKPAPQDAQVLQLELEGWKRRFGQEIQANIFYPAGEWGKEDLLSFPAGDYYQYLLARAGGEKAVVLSKIFSPQSSKLANPSFAGTSQPLSREELTELIDLSLDLKKA